MIAMDIHLLGPYGSFRFDASGAYLNDYGYYRLHTDSLPFENIAVATTTARSSCTGMTCFDMVGIGSYYFLSSSAIECGPQ